MDKSCHFREGGNPECVALAVLVKTGIQRLIILDTGLRRYDLPVMRGKISGLMRL
jgi:hypothetical protein